MTTDPKNQQSALQGNDVARDLTIGNFAQTINYNQIIQEAKLTGGSLINLPQTNVTFFAGRDDDLKKVHELLQKNQRVAAVAFVKGMGGVGKSELALQYSLRHFLTDYSGGICWLRANEGTLPTQLQDFVQIQLGEMMPDGLDSGEKLAGHCWRRLSDRLEGQMLVVLDDVKSSDDVNPFLPPQNGKFWVLATTRLVLGKWDQQYTLDVLVLAAAVDLLKSFLPEADPRRGNDAEIERLCEWLGRLPLAIELVGRYLALPNQLDTGISEILQRLQGECMVQLSQITDEERKLLPKNLNVAASFFLSWQELSPLAQRLACMLGLFALAPIPWELAENAALFKLENIQSSRLTKFINGLENIQSSRLTKFINKTLKKNNPKITKEDLKKARGELLNINLLQVIFLEDVHFYHLHQLLREYFKFQYQKHSEWSNIKDKLICSLIKFCNNLSNNENSSNIATSYLKPHLGILKDREKIFDICKSDNEFIEDVLRGFGSLRDYYEKIGSYSIAEDWGIESLEIRKKFYSEQHSDIAQDCSKLAHIYNMNQKYNDAVDYFKQAIQKYKKAGEMREEIKNVIKATRLNFKLDIYYEFDLEKHEKESENLSNDKHDYDLRYEIKELRQEEDKQAKQKEEKRLNSVKEEIKIAVVGYRNTGKTSFIRTLVRDKVGIVEDKAGSTIEPEEHECLTNIKLVDCPGFISIDQYQSYRREKEEKLLSKREILSKNKWTEETIDLCEKAINKIKISDIVIYVVSLENLHDEVTQREIEEIKNTNKKNYSYY
ncbi:hypothetical protein PseudUWO311_17450 [Pseudanabaena sp. UWO311]|uniref:GTPase n=1 Tax=Pseudanabaena sp. UWO311 TaxID=2487337 RepID=UPI001159BCC7|nr:GTPase [Pseudanabaena sp. UWO311]TYQ24806.1 hypothetical protein PseudUWO311_17450 [Pseudanabaena sp. UWO311]